MFSCGGSQQRAVGHNLGGLTQSTSTVSDGLTVTNKGPKPSVVRVYLCNGHRGCLKGNQQ